MRFDYDEKTNFCSSSIRRSTLQTCLNSCIAETLSLLLLYVITCLKTYTYIHGQTCFEGTLNVSWLKASQESQPSTCLMGPLPIHITQLLRTAGISLHVVRPLDHIWWSTSLDGARWRVTPDRAIELRAVLDLQERVRPRRRAGPSSCQK